MADNYNTTSNQSDLLVTARDAAFMLGFAPSNIFAQVANSKSWDQQGDPQHGATVEFTIFNQLNPNTDTLNETTDPDGKNLRKTVKSVTIVEKGDVVTTSKKLRMTSIHNLDTATLEIVGQQAGESTDLYARSVMDAQVGSAYVTYVGQTAKASITASNKMSTTELLKGFNKLQRKNVPADPRFGQYIAVMHPDVAHDLRAETATGGFIDVSKYSPDMAGKLLRNEIGSYGGFRIVTNTNAKQEYGAGANATSTTADGAHSAGATTLSVATGLGASFSVGDIVVVDDGTDEYAFEISAIATDDLTIGECINKNGTVYRTDTAGLVTALSGGETVKKAVTVYTTYLVGFQAFGYGYAEQPNLKITGPFDKLGRLLNVGWYALHGFGELRPEACHKIFSASSVGFNG